MILQSMPNGNIMMKAISTQERRDLLELIRDSKDLIQAESKFVEKYLEKEGFEQVQQKAIGALTSATCILDTATEDAYAYMDYQVRNFLDELIIGESVVWTKG